VIVLDTHAWLWWLAAPNKLSRKAARAIERADRIGVSAASVYELTHLVERRRLRLDVPIRSWVRDALNRIEVEPLTIDAGIALDAARLHLVGDPFDRIIYATAVARDARLVTRDQRLRSWDADRAIW
jgi:PIN domain nuclease of toxin-antitoxin system